MMARPLTELVLSENSFNPDNKISSTSSETCLLDSNANKTNDDLVFSRDLHVESTQNLNRTAAPPSTPTKDEGVYYFFDNSDFSSQSDFFPRYVFNEEGQYERQALSESDASEIHSSFTSLTDNCVLYPLNVDDCNSQAIKYVYEYPAVGILVSLLFFLLSTLIKYLLPEYSGVLFTVISQCLNYLNVPIALKILT